MKVSISTELGDVFTLEVSQDLELENFLALCEFETGGQFKASQCTVMFNGNPMRERQKTLGAYGVNDGDMVFLIAKQQQQPRNPSQIPEGIPQIDFGSIHVPGTSGMQQQQGATIRPPIPVAAQQQRQQEEPDPATLREMLLASPNEIALLKERNPPLAEALLSGSLEKFTQVLEAQRRERAERELQRIRMLNADPFDAQAQEQIAEAIRLKNVESNMETAMEHAPESFGQVIMLYIDCRVNGHPVKAFVDSGAQMTIMSQACAERCNIMRLVDKRWAGVAKGVGTQKIIGRVHLGQIQIGTDFLQSSFSILEDQPMDMLLGLDMLKRHQCSIDLKRNLLHIGTTGTETPFLGEADLPPCARLNRAEAEAGPSEAEDRQLAEALARSAEAGASAAGMKS
ncbi:protein DDI1 homolog 2-like isoform X2 [Amphiura filiformis]|uniref:protein DDI1 homolog 2-like isoform X2 n=1 Tax=Amphiura filiformis TaxID=82378 RepID=UPI003B21C6A7